jgi:copper chaperone CopZ
MTLHAWRIQVGVAAAWLALAPAASHACGACAEDQIAATYDHAVVERAATSGDVVVFCTIAGPFDAARLKAAVRRVRGVEPRSVRVSVQPAAVSFAIDPKQRSPQAAVQAAQRGMPPGSRLTILRVGSS